MNKGDYFMHKEELYVFPCKMCNACYWDTRSSYKEGGICPECKAELTKEFVNEKEKAQEEA